MNDSIDKDAQHDRGLLAMSPEKVIGRPFLKPLYDPPPYQYIDDIVALVAYRVTGPRSARSSRNKWCLRRTTWSWSGSSFAPR